MDRYADLAWEYTWSPLEFVLYAKLGELLSFVCAPHPVSDFVSNRNAGYFIGSSS